ncbi:MAG: 3-hydroxyacyl-ACP dehydratase FabZ [Gammaproteobacteria bacterium]
MNINEIANTLPHRYPFQLVDKVLDYEVGKWLTAIKNVTINEPFFEGHFPGYPVMPGVLIMEALAQATGLLGFRTMDEDPSDNMLYLFVGIDKARFKRQVVPGDTLTLNVKLLKRSRNIWKFDCEAKVGDELAASAEIMCAATKKPYE